MNQPQPKSRQQRPPRHRFDKNGELAMRDEARDAAKDERKSASGSQRPQRLGAQGTGRRPGANMPAKASAHGDAGPPKVVADKLKRYSFRERGVTLHYARSVVEANNAIRLVKGTCVGFDVERRPTFVKGQREHITAVVQVSDASHVVVCHLTAMREFPGGLADLLRDSETIKVGVGIGEDAHKVYRDWGVEVKNCVDLNTLIEGTGKISLAKFVAGYLGNELVKTKKVTLSNWERDPLTEQQIEYAAADASSALHVYAELERGECRGNV